jgi:hypothetical protein
MDEIEAIAHIEFDKDFRRLTCNYGHSRFPATLRRVEICFPQKRYVLKSNGLTYYTVYSGFLINMYEEGDISYHILQKDINSKEGIAVVTEFIQLHFFIN